MYTMLYENYGHPNQAELAEALEDMARGYKPEDIKATKSAKRQRYRKGEWLELNKPQGFTH